MSELTEIASQVEAIAVERQRIIKNIDAVAPPIDPAKMHLYQELQALKQRLSEPMFTSSSFNSEK